MSDLETEAEFDIETEIDIDYDSDEQLEEEEASALEKNIEDDTVDGDSSYFVDNIKKSSPYINIMELAGLLANRSAQIEKGLQYFGEFVPPGGDSTVMAAQELFERKCPLNIRRQVGFRNGKKRFEVWCPNEMEFPPQLKEFLDERIENYSKMSFE